MFNVFKAVITMKKEIEIASPRTDLFYELAASSRRGSVRIYGRSLDEICWRHADLVAHVKSPERRAIEQGRYAEFMWQQLDRLTCPRAVALGRIVDLLERAVAALEKSESRSQRSYRPIVRTFRDRLDDAVRLSEALLPVPTPSPRNE